MTQQDLFVLVYQQNFMNMMSASQDETKSRQELKQRNLFKNENNDSHDKRQKLICQFSDCTQNFTRRCHLNHHIQHAHFSRKNSSEESEESEQIELVISDLQLDKALMTQTSIIKHKFQIYLIINLNKLIHLSHFVSKNEQRLTQAQSHDKIVCSKVQMFKIKVNDII